MSDLRESAQLRELVTDYYNQLISFEEYRVQRKVIFDIIDEDINGVISSMDNDDEVRKDSSLLHKAISFFKKNEMENDNH